MNSSHFTDENGNPTGGTTYGVGFAIGWQNGPLGRGDERQPPNGAFVEDIIRAAIDRLEFYQSTKFACDHNARALMALHDSLAILRNRTEEREQRQVEGTHQP